MHIQVDKFLALTATLAGFVPVGPGGLADDRAAAEPEAATVTPATCGTAAAREDVADPT